MSGLSFEKRQDLSAAMPLFLDVLTGKPYNTGGNVAARIVAEAAHGAGSPTPSAFLIRAAVLHADVAAYDDIHGIAPSSPGAMSDARPELKVDPATGLPINLHRPVPVPPILTNARIVLDQDGRIVGQVGADWNWAFARSLIDLAGQPSHTTPAVTSSVAEAVASVAPGRPSDDGIQAMWYHATTAYMFAAGLYGEASTQLEHVADALPNDARVLYDRGCYAEILGFPVHQLLIADVNHVRPGGQGAPGARNQGAAPSIALRIPPGPETNRDAERLFRRAIEADASLTEARVRLARLLELRGRHQEALDELSKVLTASPPRVVEFYAHLFAGRASEDLNRLEDAGTHYERALRLFPKAQSALLAKSHLALRQWDVSIALQAAMTLDTRSAALAADPWWQYELCSGRDADALLTDLWRLVNR
jgi:tetratricopeptide (TPR) repeat protein